ncbi:hypothetical protein ABJI51_07735 [Amycolatopsis sp. NEAU-NG30]|uniref:Uncharacterized protein n=1 Tax=Amycolatopsis melonis TaxID=3156488 RepID=A0ABV0L9H6_9PSEU
MIYLPDDSWSGDPQPGRLRRRHFRQVRAAGHRRSTISSAAARARINRMNDPARPISAIS